MKRLPYFVFMVLWACVALFIGHDFPKDPTQAQSYFALAFVICAAVVNIVLTCSRADDIGYRMKGKILFIVLKFIPFVCFIADIYLIFTPTGRARKSICDCGE